MHVSVHLMRTLYVCIYAFDERHDIYVSMHLDERRAYNLSSFTSTQIAKVAKSITVPGGGAKKKKAPPAPAPAPTPAPTAVPPVQTPTTSTGGALAQDGDPRDGLAAKLGEAKVEDAAEEDDDDEEEGGLC